jgi:hypothetical protein
LSSIEKVNVLLILILPYLDTDVPVNELRIVLRPAAYAESLESSGPPCCVAADRLRRVNSDGPLCNQFLQMNSDGLSWQLVFWIEVTVLQHRLFFQYRNRLNPPHRQPQAPLNMSMEFYCSLSESDFL